MKSIDTTPSLASPVDSTRSSGRLRITVLRVAALILLLAAWQWSAQASLVPSFFTSSPSEIFQQYWTPWLRDLVVNDLPTTFYEMFVGFVVGSISATAVGLLFREFPEVAAVVSPFFTAMNSMPRIALTPLFVLWFGLGSLSKIVLVISFVFFIVLGNTVAGLATSDPAHLLLARTLGASRLQSFFKFSLPGAMPTIFAGLQLGLVYSFTATIAGEMLGGSFGIGARMEEDIQTFHIARFFAALLFLIALSVLLSLFVQAIEKRLLGWREIEMRLAAR